MFESLAERIREDERAQADRKEQLVRWALIAVAAVLVCVGIYFGVRFLR